MVAANLDAKNDKPAIANTFEIDDKLTLLRSAAIYGANGSGKSNLAIAFRFMKRMVVSSSRETQAADPIKADPFRLSDATKNRGSFFEMVFLLSGTKYRYGFEVDKHKVRAEWLFAARTRTEAKLFERKGQKIATSAKFKEGANVSSLTRKNALFLSVVAQFNGLLSQKILRWWRSLNVISGLNDREYRYYTVKCFEKDRHKKEILLFLKKLDLGIDDFVVDPSKGLEKEAIRSLSAQLRPLVVRDIGESIGRVKTAHRRFDRKGKGGAVEMLDLDSNESEGTKKLFFLAGPLMDTLKHGRVLFIDEFDARLHPLITLALIDLFNSPQSNPRNAQLLFATHDANLLSSKVFRRDQVWFTEKDKFGATHLHSLAEYKVRNDASFDSDYIRGKYGAIPFVGDLRRLLGDRNGE